MLLINVLVPTLKFVKRNIKVRLREKLFNIMQKEYKEKLKKIRKVCFCPELYLFTKTENRKQID